MLDLYLRKKWDIYQNFEIKFYNLRNVRWDTFRSFSRILLEEIEIQDRDKVCQLILYELVQGLSPFVILSGQVLETFEF